MTREGLFGRLAAPGSPGRSQIALQVWLGLAALLVIIGATIIVALAVIVSLNRHEASFSDRSVPYAQAVDDAARNAKAVANDERGFLITGDRGFVTEARSRARRAEAAFAAGLAAASGATQRRALADARRGFGAWLTRVRREFATYDAGDRRQVIATSMGAGRAVRKRYEASLGHAAQLGNGAIRSADRSIDSASTRSIAILIACLVLALALGGAIAMWLARSIMLPVSRLVSVLNQADTAVG